MTKQINNYYEDRFIVNSYIDKSNKWIIII